MAPPRGSRWSTPPRNATQGDGTCGASPCVQDTNKWAREFWHRPPGLLDDEHVVRRQTVEGCTSLLRSVLSSFPDDEWPRIQDIVVEHLTNRMSAWENIVWILVRDEPNQAKVVDIKTTLNTMTHPFVAELVHWLGAPMVGSPFPWVRVKGHPSTTRLPPELKDANVHPRPRGFEKLEREWVKDMLHATDIYKMLQRIQQRYAQRTIVTIRNPRSVLLAPIHTERCQYFRWLCARRGNTWVTFEEVHDIFGWQNCPDLGLTRAPRVCDHGGPLPTTSWNSSSSSRRSSGGGSRTAAHVGGTDGWVRRECLTWKWWPSCSDAPLPSSPW